MICLLKMKKLVTLARGDVDLYWTTDFQQETWRLAIKPKLNYWTQRKNFSAEVTRLDLSVMEPII